jgi:hypothetical protein
MGIPTEQLIMHTLKISELSKTPFGRKIPDGKNSGERFRKEFLVPSLNNHKKVIVDLNDVIEGYEYGSSFLHEAFGGLVQHDGFRPDDLKKKMKIEYDHEDIVSEIWEYIENPKKYN